MNKIPEQMLKSLMALRGQIRAGNMPSQPVIDLWAQDLMPYLQSAQDETLSIVDATGHLLPFIAPRWLCHLLGLRHLCAHLLLHCRQSGSEDLKVLQVRSWDKTDSPGHIDITVGGHVTAGDSPLATIRREMHEELGIVPELLIRGSLHFRGSYDSYNTLPTQHFFNAEYRHVYTGELINLEAIRFEDGEVVGLYLCPGSQFSALLQQKILPLGDALKQIDKITDFMP